MTSTYVAPPNLHKGDKIIITAPAGRIVPEKISRAEEYLQAEGFRVDIMPHATGNYFMFSGTDEERLADLQQAMDDPECRAILIARGGYGLVRILDKLDMRGFLNSPKWVIGFSDVTCLHARLQGFNFQSIHGPMTGAFLNPGDSGVLPLLDMLKGQRLSLEIATHRLNRQGKSEGLLIGGNLSILSSLIGSPDEPETDGKILFLEDVGEYLYRIDRMLYSLKRAHKLDNLSGMVVGGFTDMKDGEPGIAMQAEELIRQIVEDYDYPVCFGFPAGHLDYNYPMVLGAKVSLSVDDENVTFDYI